MRIVSLFAIAALLAAGCSVSGQPPEVAPAASQPTSAYRINGVARYFGAPLGDAEIAVIPFGQAAPVATARSGPDGRFLITVPETWDPDALFKMVATRGSIRVVTVSKTPARKLLQVSPEDADLIVIDELRTLVFFVVGARLEALAMLASQGDGRVAGEVTSPALQSFYETVRALTERPWGLSEEAFTKALDGAVDATGKLSATTETKAYLASLIPPAVAPLIKQQADNLAALIRQEVAKGKDKPESSLIGSLPLGSIFAAPVFEDGDGGSGGVTPPSSGGADGVNIPPPTLALDAVKYEGIASPAVITVTDFSVARPAHGPRQVKVVASSKEEAGETFTLTETSPGAGIFKGEIGFRRQYNDLGQAVAVAEDGKLTVYADVDVANDPVRITYKGLTASASYAEPRSTITGFVRVGGTLRPRAAVTLTAADNSTRRTASRADGAYAFYDVPPGTYTVTFAAAGALPQSHRVTVPQP